MKKNNGKGNVQEEFGVEIGDLNAIKFYEAAKDAGRKENEEKTPKKEK
ncbi:hypothetical protein MXL46_12390 [Heyndrickxia sporothermodurans]|uniref:Uncharacterized protein n=1 Tax=Heyndrickxia sporothermodurans TaxID=46224 RepID=A0A150LEM6_9BACI|nr:hypothetical protein [Heyndrickxia sporothermodurans]KYD10182.1 hypothetical protein B4102_0366 [Heyndrickxia sporothermodurans]MBL5767642.1 hypothetical protein [Heyndrickxia sporothermodurans]MBL5771145.1 hypothetical protein [Heyndrickxia sporothermodurans]MBL5775013.1 hypothetical protein [Heyndrickxia sporothermodurans]MBL5778216.1 hypothetical protein [Heyndrickxia sporothermodurans]